MADTSTTPNRYTAWLSESPWRALVAGVIVALSVATIIIALVMRPPVSELAALVRTLAATSIVSLGLGYLLYRSGFDRSPSLTVTLVVTYAWAAVVTLGNVLILAGLMFVSPHDLALAMILLLFAAIIATAYGVFVSASVTDGLRQLAATARKVAGGDLEARAQVTGRDEVARAARAFNEMARQLQEAEAQRVEVENLRRDLVAWTSHDLRTPLTAIRVMVEALDDGVVDDPVTVHRYLGSIRSDVMALNALIDDLFELAQLEAGGLTLEMDEHSLSDLISDSLESFGPLANKRDVSLSGSVDKDLDPVVLNPPKIVRALNNLISNALQHAPRGGWVDVSAERAVGKVTVSVRDNGPGFAQEDLPRVFEQFYRGEQARSRATGGAGLGLAIAHAIVEAHGGRMWAENGADGGACVGFSLPAGPSPRH